MTAEFVVRHIREAQLIVSSPEHVASKLEQYEGKFLYKGKLQESLLARNNPLIDLALAQYTNEKEILTVLYKKSHAQPKDQSDEKYLLGLKISCLSNEYAHFQDWNIPEKIEEVFGTGEFERLVTKGSEEEIAALFANPRFFEILEALYKNKGVFASLTEDRRRLLVIYSTENPRLTLCEDNDSGPDTAYYSVHKAILSMLASAPVTHKWAYTLFDLLLVLDPKMVASPEQPISATIERWNNLLSLKENKYNEEGFYTDLLKKDELCCLIAAMYGEYQKSSIFRNRKLDLFRRCPYYGRGEMTAKEMKAGYERDKTLYLLAILQNDSVFLNPKLRKLLEEQLGYKRQLIERYSHRCQQISSRREKRDFRTEFCPWPMSKELIEYLPPELKDAALHHRNEDQLSWIEKNDKNIEKSIAWGFWLLIAYFIYTKLH